VLCLTIHADYPHKRVPGVELKGLGSLTAKQRDDILQDLRAVCHEVGGVGMV
jgi:hypothetical protein